MKRFISIALCIVMTFLLTACVHTDAKSKEIDEMFASFNKSDNCVLLTDDYLIVRDTYHDLSQIKYGDKNCNVIFLEENGFYSYTYNDDNLTVEFLYTKYEDFETVLLGSATLPSDIINAFYKDKCFWFRVDDPKTDEFNQLYCSWSVETQQMTCTDTDEFENEIEYVMDNNRSNDYSFTYHSGFIGSYLEIVDNKTNIIKRIDRSTLNTFEEGKKLKKLDKMMSFNIGKVFEKDGDIYYTSFFEAGNWGDQSYEYIVKWNFETEECEFFTSYYFEEFQDSICDMYII
ncbi:MAG: hypothetical protein IJ275_06865 [Ruminococcus sp.]|nr:hypothetical protein [Ruminococcus sp.]